MYLEAYNDWNKSGKKVETLDEAMYVVLNLIIKQCLFDEITQKTCDEESGRIISLRETLGQFTASQHSRNFEDIRCDEIDFDFLDGYRKFLQLKGIKEKNSGAVMTRFRTIKKIFELSKRHGIADFDFELPEQFENFMEPKETIKRFFTPSDVFAFENVNRNLLTKEEELHLDLFLFSYYSGGLVGEDAANLTHDKIRNDHIICAGSSFPIVSKVLLNEKAKAIIEKYKNESSGDYLLPIFSLKHKTELQRRGRLKRLTEKINLTLKKISSMTYRNEVTWNSARIAYITKIYREGKSKDEIIQYGGNRAKTIYENYIDTLNY